MKKDSKRSHFPFFIACRAQVFLVVGGGRVAQRRVETLLNFDFKLYLVSPKVTPEIEDMARAGQLIWRKGTFELDDLKDVFCVTACTDDPSVNAQVGAACRERGIWVNLCDNPGACDYYFPAVALGEMVVAGVTGDGVNHGAAARAARQVRRALNESDINLISEDER